MHVGCLHLGLALLYVPGLILLGRAVPSSVLVFGFCLASPSSACASSGLYLVWLQPQSNGGCSRVCMGAFWLASRGVDSLPTSPSIHCHLCLCFGVVPILFFLGLSSILPLVLPKFFPLAHLPVLCTPLTLLAFYLGWTRSRATHCVGRSDPRLSFLSSFFLSVSVPVPFGLQGAVGYGRSAAQP